MKALILAAGRGTRLGALTENTPKPMLKIAGVPMLERIMSGIRESTGIGHFVIVTGYKSGVIRDYFKNGDRWGFQIEYVNQGEPKGLGHAIQCAASYLNDSPFLITYGDIIIDSVNYNRVLTRFSGDTRCAVIGLNWVEDPWRGAAVKVDNQYRVLHIEEKPPKGTAGPGWNNAGLFIFPPDLFDYTAKLPLSPRGEYELPDAINAMIDNGYAVYGTPVTGAWRDVGTPEDYYEINRELGEV